MMTPTLLQRVVRSMETIAPLSLTETAWDNTGLLLEAPFPRQSASQILLTIDLTQRVLDEAINNKHVGVIIAYHPPLFKSFKRLVMGDDRQRIALRCAAAGISVYSPHSALDNCIGAKGLGSGRTVAIKPILNPPHGQEGAGSGRIHYLDTPVPFAVLAKTIKAYLGIDYIRISKSSLHATKLVQSVAICCGSGASVFGLATTSVDLWLTGEMSHHEILGALAKDTSVILTEHTNSERGYLSSVLQPRLLSLLKVDLGLDVESDVKVDVVCSQVDRDPLEIM